MACSQNAGHWQPWNHQPKEEGNGWDLKAVVCWKEKPKPIKKYPKHPNKSQDNPKTSASLIILVLSHDKNCIWRSFTPSSLFNQHQFTGCIRQAQDFCRANSFAQVLHFSLSLLVLKEIAHTFKGYLVLLAALCTVSESSSCFLSPPAHLQMFQSLNWIPKLHSRWHFNAHFKSGSYCQNTAQNKERLELCHHRNRIKEL